MNPRKSAEIHKLEGTYRPSRHDRGGIPELPGNPQVPKDLRPDEQAIWREKMAIFRAQGRQMAAFRHALKAYCRLEAAMNRAWDAGELPSAAHLGLLAKYQQMFQDVPASADAAPAKKPSNRFAS